MRRRPEPPAPPAARPAASPIYDALVGEWHRQDRWAPGEMPDLHAGGPHGQPWPYRTRWPRG